MKARHILLVGALLGALACGGPSTDAPGPVGERMRLDPVHYLGARLVEGNLTVWPVYAEEVIDVGDFLTLAEAVEQGSAEVRELGGGAAARQNDVEQNDVAQVAQILNGAGASVGTLEVENKGDLPILVLAGTIVKGGQQDRQIGQDFVIPAAQTVPVDAFCVEQSRWTNARLGNDTLGRFEVLSQVAMTVNRAPAQYMNDQNKVWENVAKTKMLFVSNSSDGALVPDVGANAAAALQTSSLAVVLDASQEVANAVLDARIAAVAAHLAASRGRGHLVGFAYAVDGKVVNVRTFAHPGLFARQEAAFVRTMATEAFLTERSRPEGAEPPPSAAAEDVVELIRSIGEAEEVLAETAAQNDNGYRKSDAGWNGNCYLELPGGKRAALTRDWTSK